jgi:hypothetical protein
VYDFYPFRTPNPRRTHIGAASTDLSSTTTTAR